MNAGESILVLGATGGQGGAVAAALGRRDVPIRALVRRAESAGAQRLGAQGAELATGTLDDVDALTAAMSGIRAVFAMTTPFEGGTDAEIAQGRTILAAAAQARVPHLVFSSVASADADSGVPHFESKAVIERDLRDGDVPFTILGPTYFFENALSGLDELRAGVLDLPLPGDRPLQQVARRDLGEFAARVLTAPAEYVGRRIELASDAPTPEQMAAAFAAALGRPVEHRTSDPSRIGNADMRAMWTFLNRQGYSVDLAALHAEAPDVAWTTYEDWARQALNA
ncbi:NmrA/HSCARG family protein [Pseudonocardia halophobica]|uniref:NmrA/HSCARG family protein n=1 Tax=Pseudonocardia halophobica TaxID=29401 RepID=UPI003D935F22